MTASHDLDLKPVGNCALSGLLDRHGRYVWACAPRFDSDPLFSNLISGVPAGDEAALGVWSVEVEDLASVEQSYLRNTPVVRTVLTDARGAAVEIVDFCPRYRRSGRVYRPTAFVRRLRPLSGAPRIVIRLRPARNWGAQACERTSGSNHIRYIGSDLTLRLTTNVAVSHILAERPFRLEEEVGLFLGPDEPFSGHLLGAVQSMLAETKDYWREWVRTLAVPLDWQEVVIRAAIALKLCAWEETGAIVAAMTTSIPEAPNSGRNWDYRYCWIRD
jgi:hypothetical protein